MGSIALGLLFSTLVFYLVTSYQQPRRIQEVALSSARSRQRPSLGAWMGALGDYLAERKLTIPRLLYLLWCCREKASML